MTTLKIVKADRKLTDLIKRSIDECEPILLTTDGKEKAVLIGLLPAVFGYLSGYRRSPGGSPFLK